MEVIDNYRLKITRHHSTLLTEDGSVFNHTKKRKLRCLDYTKKILQIILLLRSARSVAKLPIRLTMTSINV